VEKPTVLIVEDDPQLNFIFSLSLDQDFQVVSMMNGELAVKYLEDHQPDIIVLDLNLPGYSGRQILNYIKKQERLGCMRIIMATADAATADELVGQVDLVLLKPISPSQLKSLANRLKTSDC
jgi:DNA-binding response OmpR family regulator